MSLNLKKSFIERNEKNLLIPIPKLFTTNSERLIEKKLNTSVKKQTYLIISVFGEILGSKNHNIVLDIYKLTHVLSLRLFSIIFDSC